MFRRRLPIPAAVRSPSRCLAGAALALTALSASGFVNAEAASQIGALHAPTNYSGPPLTLAAAGELALEAQPVLLSRTASIAARDDAAVVAAQLPDPTLMSGLRDVPVNSRERFSLRKDDFTVFTVGVRQEFPRGAKRRLRGARLQLQADAERFVLADEQRAVRRDAGLAWLEVYAAEQGLLLAHALALEATLQAQALAKDYRNGAAAQADWLEAKVDGGLAADQENDWLHRAQRARAGLARWLGEQPARRPLAALPAGISLAGGNSLPTGLAALLARVEMHPRLSGAGKQIDAAGADVALARQSYKPDFAVEGYFAWRQDFPDFVGLQVSVDLPLFTHDRQNRALAATLHLADASAEQRNDLLRSLRAEVEQAYVDWRHYASRAAEFDSQILSDARRRSAAAQAAYAAGRGSFAAILAARRNALDVQLQRLALAVESVRAQVRLQYLVGEGDTP